VRCRAGSEVAAGSADAEARSDNSFVVKRWPSAIRSISSAVVSASASSRSNRASILRASALSIDGGGGAATGVAGDAVHAIEAGLDPAGEAVTDR